MSTTPTITQLKRKVPEDDFEDDFENDFDQRVINLANKINKINKTNSTNTTATYQECIDIIGKCIEETKDLPPHPFISFELRLSSKDKLPMIECYESEKKLYLIVRIRKNTLPTKVQSMFFRYPKFMASVCIFIGPDETASFFRFPNTVEAIFKESSNFASTNTSNFPNVTSVSKIKVSSNTCLNFTKTIDVCPRLDHLIIETTKDDHISSLHKHLITLSERKEKFLGCLHLILGSTIDLDDVFPIGSYQNHVKVSTLKIEWRKDIRINKENLQAISSIFEVDCLELISYNKCSESSLIACFRIYEESHLKEICTILMAFKEVKGLLFEEEHFNHNLTTIPDVEWLNQFLGWFYINRDLFGLLISKEIVKMRNERLERLTMFCCGLNLCGSDSKISIGNFNINVIFDRNLALLIASYV